MNLSRFIDQWLGTNVTFAKALLERIKEKLEIIRGNPEVIQVENWRIDAELLEELRLAGRALGQLELLDFANELTKFNEKNPQKGDEPLDFAQSVEFWMTGSEPLLEHIDNLLVDLQRLSGRLIRRWLIAFVLLTLTFVVSRLLADFVTHFIPAIRPHP